jgi:hypothetical protein
MVTLVNAQHASSSGAVASIETTPESIMAWMI